MGPWVRLRRAVLAACARVRSEERAVLRMANGLGLGPGRTALDVGCGSGRYLRLLGNCGWDVTGVDIDPDVVERHRRAGARVLSPAEVGSSSQEYDLVVMSHVIEHLAPAELRAMLDSYLDRLRVGGHLIICTPELSARFYDDFDHVRPYNPSAIEMVFGAGQLRAPFRSGHRLELRDLWYRRRPRQTFAPALRGFRRHVWMNAIRAVLFALSRGTWGQTDGWVGLYRRQT